MSIDFLLNFYSKSKIPFFDEKVPDVKEGYEKNFAGLFSEYTNAKEMEKKFNFILCSSDILYTDGKLNADTLKRHLQIPEDLTEFTSFAMILQKLQTIQNICKMLSI